MVYKCLEGINWIEWQESKKTSELEMSYLSEEIDVDEDRQRLISIAMLSDTVKRVRLAQLTSEVCVDVSIPSDFKTGLRIKRQKVKLKYGLEKSHTAPKQ